jgi:single-stranded-DNA-specific exonuclease
MKKDTKEMKRGGEKEYHPLTLTLLAKRGIEGEEAIERFLNPSYERDISDPFLIHGVKKAVDRIMSAMKGGERIAVYSDYDCDGVPGGVLLRTFFDDIGYPVEMYIPHRHNEGYGVHKHAIDTLKKKGVALIITVDSGITNIEEVAYAKSVGVDFIVTDHHLPVHDEKVGKGGKHKQVVPDAVAVINSKQDVCEYHDDMLCGCAVAWKLSCALLSTLRTESKAQEETGKKKQEARIDVGYRNILEKVARIKEGYEKWLLDLVGISTIADMVPLQKENRALAYFGLKVLQKTRRPALQNLFLNQGVASMYITEDDIAFTIAPRINAASRMGDPMQAHNMLYERDSTRALTYLTELEALNQKRKDDVKDIALTIDYDHSAYADDVIVVGDVTWSPGILGLIAQKIIDETSKSTFVWGQGEDKSTVKGSCRSRGDVHVVDLMRIVHEKHSDVLLAVGGHEQAGGFTASLEHIDTLRALLNNAYKEVEKKEIQDTEEEEDAILTFDDVHEVTHRAVSALAPFGVGNKKPLFAFRDSSAVSVRWFGKKSEHLEIQYESSKGKVKAIQFFAPKELEEKVKKKHTLLAHLEKSYFRGKGELRLRVVRVI